MSSYQMTAWGNAPVFQDGQRLIFELEPSGCSDFDTLECETLGEVFEAIESQVDVLEVGEKVPFSLNAVWVTEAQWAERQERHVTP